MSDKKNYLQTALLAAERGGKVITKGFYQKKDIALKGFGDPVTQFDKESEERIVKTIKDEYPGHSILTEEELTEDNQVSERWIIDPLDGTVNFTHRIPYVCVSIALEIDGRVEVAVVHNPLLSETYTAIRNEGAFLNGEPIRVSQIAEESKAMIVTGFPYEREDRLDEVFKPMKQIIQHYESFRRLGSAAMDLVYVADGRCEAFYEENLKAWDMAAGALIVSEAGGVVTDYYGNPFQSSQKTILASNKEMHPKMLSLLSDIKKPG